MVVSCAYKNDIGSICTNSNPELCPVLDDKSSLPAALITVSDRLYMDCESHQRLRLSLNVS